MRRTPIYLQIVEELQKQIRSNFYSENKSLPSRAELCENYNISAMTAVKVHNELERTGFAYKIKGKGVFVHPALNGNLSSTILQEEKKLAASPNIVIHMHKSSVPTAPHMSNIIAGIQQRAFELSLNCRCEMLSLDTHNSAILKEDDALLVPYYANCEWVLPVLKRKRVRCVVINNYFPETHSVVFDNYHGMTILLDYLESKKCKKIFLCTRHFCDLGMANLSERTYAFENECQRRGLKYKILFDGNFQKLLNTIKEDKPDAVVGASDEPALELQNLLSKRKLQKKPIICGFDAIGNGLENIVSVKTDYRKMGREAVDITINNTLEDWLMPDVTRVRSELLINI